MVNADAYELGTNRSCIRELFEYGLMRARVVGKDKVYDFSLGNPCIPAPEEVRQTIESLLRETDSLTLHGYTSAVGDYETRQAIADDLNRRFDAHAQAEDLFITCGAAPGLCAVLGGLSVPGGKVLALAPYFPEYKPFTLGAGLEFDYVKADVPAFQIPFDALKEALTPNVVALIVNSPNNPAGTVYTRQTLSRLSALLTEKAAEFGHPIYIISDEPYRELVYGDAKVSFIPKLYKDTIVCYSYSKSLSLPGERIGYVYVPSAASDSRAVYGAVAGAARKMGHVCAPSLWQKVIARCTALRPDLLSYDRNRRALYEGLTEMGYTVAKPEGAFYLFVKAPNGDSIAFSQLAKSHDLLIVPGEGFGCAGWVRLCYCVSYDTIMGSLPIFKKLMDTL